MIFINVKLLSFLPLVSEGGRWYSLPEELGECWEPREAERGPPAPGGDPPALRGDPGGRVSATDINAAMGD